MFSIITYKASAHKIKILHYFMISLCYSELLICLNNHNIHHTSSQLYDVNISIELRTTHHVIIENSIINQVSNYSKLWNSASI